MLISFTEVFVDVNVRKEILKPPITQGNILDYILNMKHT